MGGSKILVVDDDPAVLDLLAVNFELEGHTVLRAVDGADGIEQARRQHPDVIVSDIMMPRSSGLDLVAAVKGDPTVGHIPVLLLSARARAADVQAGLTAGADDYLTKPFDLDELLQRVDQLLSR